MNLRHLFSRAAAAAAIFVSYVSLAADDTKADSRYPYRTDFANGSLPWYQLKSGEFPPMHSDHRVTGELVEMDFIHRSGKFREVSTGILREFTLLPFGNVVYLNAPADLRDVPLGTDMLFMLFQDEKGNFSKAGTIEDNFTILAGHGMTYRLDEARLAEEKLLVTTQNIPKKQPNLGQNELTVTKDTRVWKGDKLITLNDLAVGDALLVNLTGKDATNRGRCTDIWVGEDTHQSVTAAQRAKHAAFNKLRGLPALVDHVDGRKVFVHLLSWNETATKQELQMLLDTDLAVGKGVDVAPANDELRTFNPPVDKARSTIREIKKSSADGMGNSGVALVVEPTNLLEGFRQGRAVRIFPMKWPIDDMPWGETLSSYRQHPSAETHENLAKEYPAIFPYRTDYGGAELSWYQLQPGVAPPPYSEHTMFGELVKVDAAKRSGQFRTDHTGEVVDFTLTDGARLVRITQPKAGAPFKKQETIVSVMHHDAEASLADVPVGTRCRFRMYQDEHGAFTKVGLMMDDFTWLALNQMTYRLDAIDRGKGELKAGRQIPPPFDYHNERVTVPDLGCAILHVDESTQVWKNGQPAKLADLAVGDSFVVNLTGEGSTTPSRCREIWIGPESQKLASDTQAQKFAGETKTPAPPKAKTVSRK